MKGMETNPTITALRDAVHRWEDGASQAYQDLMLSEYLDKMGFFIASPIPPIMTGLQWSGGDTLTLHVGDITSIFYVTLPANARMEHMSVLASTNQYVAILGVDTAIQEVGIIALAAGTETITVSTSDGRVSATLTITVVL
jgi:hypothetical protein